MAKKIPLFAILFLSIVIVIGMVLTKQQIPLPDREIVYIEQAPDGDSLLVFAHPDGSEVEKISNLHPGYAVSWSPSGNYLGYRRQPDFVTPGGYPVLVDLSGNVFRCPDLEISYGPIRFFSDTQIGLIQNIVGVDEIIGYDLLECQNKGVEYIGQVGERIIDFDYSYQGWLAVTFYSNTNNQYGIRILNGEQEITKIPYAIYPFWSLDGEFLAFSYPNENEFYLATSNKFGGDIKKYLEPIAYDRGLNIAWSPDNRSLLFYKSPYIFRLSLSTGEKSKVCENCFSPDWRQRK